MRNRLFIIFVALLFIAACSPEPKTEEQKTFYALGATVNKQLAVFDMSPEERKYFLQGLSDASAGKKLVADPDANLQKINDLAKARMVRSTARQKALSKTYLEKAAAEKGAQKTPSGLIYKEIRAGTGVHPKPTDIAKVHYIGTLIDGREFENSIKRGQPVDMHLGRVIRCWAEGIRMMKVGGKAKLFCPSAIAYGDNGRPPNIPGGAAVIIEVELLDVQSSR